MRVAGVTCIFVVVSLLLSAYSVIYTVTSEDGVFHVTYRPGLILCERSEVGAGATASWVPADACRCDDEDGDASTLVCIAKSKESYRDKPTLNSASFFVAEVPTAKTARPCLAGSQYWNVEGAQNIVIHSTKFRHFRVHDAAMSHYLTSDMYRTFHGKKCYELAIEEMITSAGAFDPGTFKEFTKQDEEDVRESLTQVLESFTFLK